MRRLQLRDACSIITELTHPVVLIFDKTVFNLYDKNRKPETHDIIINHIDDYVIVQYPPMDTSKIKLETLYRANVIFNYATGYVFKCRFRAPNETTPSWILWYLKINESLLFGGIQ